MSRYVVALITAVPARPASRPFLSADMPGVYPGLPSRRATGNRADTTDRAEALHAIDSGLTIRGRAVEQWVVRDLRPAWKGDYPCSRSRRGPRTRSAGRWRE